MICIQKALSFIAFRERGIDILVNNEPLLFQKDIYATACLAGGIVYWLMLLAGTSVMAQGIACAFTVIVIRLLAVRYGWSLPVLVEEVKKNKS